MASAKEIVVKVIPSKIANEFVRKNHYSGRTVNTSQLHLGAFLGGVLHGVMSFGPPMVKRNMLSIVDGTGWDNMMELNRMAFDEVLPRNSESRCISIAFRMIRQKAPQIKWVVSFADATQCGDGAIYRASGFSLVSIKKNNSLYQLKDGRVINNLNMTGKYMLSWLKSDPRISSSWSYNKNAKILGAEKVKGFQLKYIYFIDPSYRDKLTVPIIPFPEIEKRGAKMYLGKRPGSVDSCTVSSQDKGGGANPTPGLNYG